MAARQDAERVEKFAPRELTFEFIVKVNDARELVDLALLILDDPRRSIRAQLSQLPASSTQACGSCCATTARATTR